MTRILVVEDEPDMQFVLSDNLGTEGYEVDLSASGREAVGKALSGEYALVLLDIMLPDINGIEVCKLIRSENATIPIIILTAKGEEIDKVVGLEVGADDYITKPFSIRELLARIKAALRRAGQLHPDGLRECVIGEVAVNFSRHEIAVDKRAERLTRYENDLLQFLVANRGQVVARERILREVWGLDPTPANRTVDNYIARLRSRIEPDPAKPQHILTVHGKGYRLA
jgi:DNA-binding response OmpR family regulator